MILRVIRRGLAIGALWLGLLGTGAGASDAGPEGPSLSFVQLGLKPETSEIRIASADGSGTRTIAGGGPGDGPLPYPFSGLAWTPDGGRVVFSGSPGALYRDPSQGDSDCMSRMSRRERFGSFPEPKVRLVR